MNDEPKTEPRGEFKLSMQLRDAVRAEVNHLRREQELEDGNELPIGYSSEEIRRRRPAKPRDMPMRIIAIMAVCVTVLLVATIGAMAYAGAPVSQFVDLVKWAMLSVAIPAGARLLKGGQEK